MMRQGMLVGLTQDIDQQTAQAMAELLTTRYPSITFTILTHAAGHILFNYNDGQADDTPIVRFEP